MPYTKRQIAFILSIVWLIAAAALAGYASSRLSRLSIPLSPILSNLTTLLPIVAGVLLQGSSTLTRSSERRRVAPGNSTPRSPLVAIANTLIFIYSTCVITLLGTHAAPPSGLDCSLQSRWTSMFSRKDSDGIRAIQDAFNCCGLVNSHDRAWPFPDKTHDVHACETAFGRDTGCMGAWRGEEQRLAGSMMGVVGMVFVWQLLVIVNPCLTNRSSWLHRVAPERISDLLADEEQGNGHGSSRAIDYHPDSDRYRDNAVAEVTDSENEHEHATAGQPHRSIEAGKKATKRITGGGENGHGEQGHNNVQQHDEPTDNAWARQQ